MESPARSLKLPAGLDGPTQCRCRLGSQHERGVRVAPEAKIASLRKPGLPQSVALPAGARSLGHRQVRPRWPGLQIRLFNGPGDVDCQNDVRSVPRPTILPRRGSGSTSGRL